jgi:hypothetical protein
MDSMEPPKVEQMVEQTWNKRGTDLFLPSRSPLFREASSRSLFLEEVLFYSIFEFWGMLKILSFGFDIVSTIKIRIGFGSELSDIFLVLKSIKKRLDMICCIVFFFPLCFGVLDQNSRPRYRFKRTFTDKNNEKKFLFYVFIHVFTRTCDKSCTILLSLGVR